MIIEKTILTNSILNNNGINVKYTDDLLNKIATQKGEVDILLNDHNGKNIGKCIGLDYNGKELIAKMDIPNEYIIPNVDVGFSTDIIPVSYRGKGSDVKLVDGYLDKVVFLSNLEYTDQPNDKNTITRLLNTKEDGNMANDDLSRLYGQLQEENRILKEEIDTLKQDNGKLTKKVEKANKDYEALQLKYEEGEALYNKGKAQYEETLKVANEYKELREAEKTELLQKLVPSDEKGEQDEFKLKMYSKLEIDELKSLINDEPPAPSTPPKGATGDGMGIVDDVKNNVDESTIYLEAKEAFNL